MKRFLFLSFLLVITACTKREPVFFQSGSFFEPPKAEQPSQPASTVSVLLPLSGESAEVGQSLQKAALLSLFEHKSTPMKLLFFDTQSSGEGAKQAYDWALAQKPDVVIGPVFSSEVAAIKEHGISRPLLTFTSDTTVIRDDVASMAVLIPDQIQKLVSYACEKGQHRLAVLGPEDKTGEIAMNALSDAVKTCPGMRLSHVSLYDKNTMNFTPAVLKIIPKVIRDRGNLTPEEKELANTPMKSRISFDALFVFESGIKLRQLASLLNFYEINPRQVPTYGLASVKQVKDKNANGIIFADVEDAGYTHFSQNYKRQFGKQPVRLASLIYDALNMAFERTEMGNLSMDDLRRTPYQGIDGLIQLQPDGTNRRALQIVKKAGNYNVLIQAADMADAYNEVSGATIESDDLALVSPGELDEYQDSFE